MSSNQITWNPFFAGLDELRSSWGWILALGIVLMVSGGICIWGSVAATFATVLVLGWMLLFAGGVSLVQAFRVRTWSGFFLYFFTALLRGVTGYLLIRYPGSGAVAITLLLASLFIVGGGFRAVASAMLQFPRWGWSLVSGLASIVLGCMLLAQMPVSSLWFVGFAVGVDMFLDGSSLIAFSTAIHSLPKLTLSKTKAA